jgi:phosphonate transport system ATP-binding protein
VQVQSALTMKHVSKSFERGSKVLSEVNFSISQGEMVALIGASGSGKSTLIRAIAGLIPIDKSNGTGTGEILLFGSPMQRNGKVTRQAKALRVRTGVVFQQFNLVPRLNVLTNVCIGLLGQIGSIRGTFGFFTSQEKRKALRALERVGIVEQALKPGSQLSGGQQQRAAIARTLVQGAELLIADEPIASLDPSSARRVMDILADLNSRDGITVLVSLHQVEYAIKYCPRTIALRAGEVIYDGPSSALTRSLLSSLYGDESAELFVPGFDRFGHEDSQPSQKARILDGASVFAVSNTFSILKSDDAALAGAP